LKILGQNETYILYFLPPSCPKIVPAPLRGADIYRCYKQIQQFSKNCDIDRNIMCFIMNIIFANKNFQPILFPYPFQSSAIVRICFEAGIQAQICLKLCHFY